MESRQQVQKVQGLFGDLQVVHTHDHDDELGPAISTILPHKFEKASHGVIDGLASGPSLLPTIEFSSDDLRSQHHYSLRQSPRPSGDLGILRLSSQCSERARESKTTICERRKSSPGTTARSMEESISSFQRLVGKIQELVKCRWLRSSQPKKSR